VSELIDILRVVVREELAHIRAPELAIVVGVYANDADGNNHQVDVRLRGSNVELQRVPVTVPRYGVSMLPRIADLVLVAFVGGALNAPVMIGVVYDENTQPPEAAPGELVYTVPDEGGERHVHLELPSGMTCTVDDTALKIAAGGTELTLEQDGDVTIKAGGNLGLNAQGDVTVEAGGALNLKAGTEATIEGLSVTAQGSAETKVKGATVGIAGIVQFSAS
jgi:hypothetical protein